MIEVISEYIVQEEARGQFELAYGPGGAWSELFARCEGFRGASLLRDTAHPQRYLAVEVWDTEEQREQALAEGQVEYAALTLALDAWAESSARVGVFRMLGQAAVRPRGRARPAGAGESRRRSR